MRTVPNKPTWWKIVSLVCVTTALVSSIYHLLGVGPRWPVILLYVVIAWATIRLLGASSGKWTSWSIAGSKKQSYAVIGVAGLLPFCLPLFTTLEPTGSFQVGTLTRHLIDENRPEQFSENTSDYREPMIRVWYPVEVHQEKEVKPLSMSDMMAPALQANGLPGFLFGYLDRIPSHSRPNLPIAVEEKSGELTFPVILFSHGFSAYAAQSMFLVEELASHGYVVVGIDHTYNAAITQFPDGREIMFKEETMDNFYSKAMEMAVIWSEDASFVIDELSRMNEDDPILANTLNLSHIGMVGHSFGGTATILTLASDSRISAGIAMDSPLSFVSEPVTISRPMMLVDAERSRIDYPVKKQLFENMGRDGYWIELKGANHDSFTDTPMLSPLLASFHIDKQRAYRLINRYTLQFLNDYVTRAGSPSLSTDEMHDDNIEFIRK